MCKQLESCVGQLHADFQEVVASRQNAHFAENICTCPNAKLANFANFGVGVCNLFYHHKGQKAA